MQNITPEKFKKVYFSKKGIQNGRSFGEESLIKIFKNNGFTIFQSHFLSIRKTLEILKGCEEFAATSGTASHNAIFLEDKKKCIVLNRSEHLHPIQHMISSMRRHNTFYLDAYAISSDQSFGDAPCLLKKTPHVANFITKKNIKT